MTSLDASHYKLLLQITSRPNCQMTFLPADDTTIAKELVKAGKLRIVQQQPFTVEAIENGWA